ncbi:MAG TPA: hypothetical protein DCP71_11785, partial [Verrucomicrobiales bacterium]|nr:hypothetical protein [Verrucomicrobiales bacterium]
PRQLAWTYRLRPLAAEWAPPRLQQSVNLVNWTDFPPSAITTNPDGSQTARLPLIGRGFMRLKVDR